MVEHKFKSNLRLKCDVRKEELLFCLSGGPSSTCMVQMAARSLVQNASGKKMLFKPVVLVIDESILYNYSLEPVENFLKQLKYLCKQFLL
jgi:hypothetical protein